jgi:hypothetical protein
MVKQFIGTVHQQKNHQIMWLNYRKTTLIKRNITKPDTFHY